MVFDTTGIKGVGYAPDIPMGLAFSNNFVFADSLGGLGGCRWIGNSSSKNLYDLLLTVLDRHFQVVRTFVAGAQVWPA